MNPQEFRYSSHHVWCAVEEDGNIRLGMTDYFQAQLKNIIYLELPKPGAEICLGDALASFESQKIASDLLCPISGRIIEINEDVLEQPNIINKSPNEHGWLVRIAPSDLKEFGALLSYQAYIDLVSS